MRKEARLLTNRATASLRRGAQAFNSLDDDGRTTAVLLHTQHAFEMLLKAILVERRQKVFDAKTRRSIGFDRCLTLIGGLGVAREDVGVMRVIDAMRDEEQHWLGGCDEGMLYLHMRAAVTTFDDLLRRFLEEDLARHLPTRVLPIATEAPRDISLLMDEKFGEIVRLLGPGRRSRSKAHNAIRSLLALEGHVADEIAITERDVLRVERGIRQGRSRSEVFPRLDDLHTTTEGTGLTVQVRFTRRAGGMPIRMVREGEAVDAAAVRDVDLNEKFRYGKQELADELRITTTQCKALRAELGIEGDADCSHDFTYGRSTFRRYSDAALGRLREAIRRGIDLEDVVARHRATAA